MKKLILISLVLMGCASKPLLTEGSCYDLSLYSTVDKSDPYSGSSVHELSQFKVVKIFNWEGKDHYAIQVLTDEWKGNSHDLVPKYPLSKTYGFARVNEFDKYISPNAMQFWPAWDSKVKCNKLSENKDKTSRKPLFRVGSDLDGTSK